MKTITKLLSILFLLISGIAAGGSEIKMKSSEAFDSPDILSILRFENIGLEKIIFSGNDLKNRHFKIVIKEFTGGKLTKETVAIDSAELGDFGKINSETFSFRVLAKRTLDNKARFQFQFDRFSSEKEFDVNSAHKGFVLKNFLGANTELAFSGTKSEYFLTYMMPYVRPDGSGAYCEVAQSGANPEEFGLKYNIPTYFLIDIKFQ